MKYCIIKLDQLVDLFRSAISLFREARLNSFDVFLARMFEKSHGRLG